MPVHNSTKTNRFPDHKRTLRNDERSFRDDERSVRNDERSVRDDEKSVRDDENSLCDGHFPPPNCQHPSPKPHPAVLSAGRLNRTTSRHCSMNLSLGLGMKPSRGRNVAIVASILEGLFEQIGLDKPVKL